MKNTIRKLYKFLFPIAVSVVFCLFCMCMNPIFDGVLRDDPDGWGGVGLGLFWLASCILVYFPSVSFAYSKFFLRENGLKPIVKFFLALYNALIVSVFFICGYGTDFGVLVRVFSSVADFRTFCIYVILLVIWCMIWSRLSVVKVTKAKYSLITLLMIFSHFIIMSVIDGLLKPNRYSDKEVVLMGIASAAVLALCSFIYTRFVNLRKEGYDWALFYALIEVVVARVVGRYTLEFLVSPICCFVFCFIFSRIPNLKKNKSNQLDECNIHHEDSETEQT